MAAIARAICAPRAVSSSLVCARPSWSIAPSVSVQCRHLTTAERPRDPERPKKPNSAWLFFMNDFRARAPASAPKNGAAMTKAGAAEWKALAATQRAPFDQKAEAAAQEYRKAMDAYISSGKKDAWARDPEKPKAPMSGFLRFTNEFREKSANKSSVTETTKAAGAAWKGMTESQRQPYNQAYEAEKKPFDAAMKKYKESGKEDAWKERVGIAAIEAKRKAAVQAEKAKIADQKAKAARKAEAEKKKLAAVTNALKRKLLLAKIKAKKATAAATKANAVVRIAKKKATAVAANAKAADKAVEKATKAVKKASPPKAKAANQSKAGQQSPSRKTSASSRK